MRQHCPKCEVVSWGLISIEPSRDANCVICSCTTGQLKRLLKPNMNLQICVGATLPSWAVDGHQKFGQCAPVFCPMQRLHSAQFVVQCTGILTAIPQQHCNLNTWSALCRYLTQLSECSDLIVNLNVGYLTRICNTAWDFACSCGWCQDRWPKTSLTAPVHQLGPTPYCLEFCTCGQSLIVEQRAGQNVEHPLGCCIFNGKCLPTCPQLTIHRCRCLRVKSSSWTRFANKRMFLFWWRGLMAWLGC